MKQLLINQSIRTVLDSSEDSILDMAPFNVWECLPFGVHKFVNDAKKIFLDFGNIFIFIQTFIADIFIEIFGYILFWTPNVVPSFWRLFLRIIILVLTFVLGLYFDSSSAVR